MLDVAGNGFAHADVTPQVRLSRDLDATFDWLIKPVTEEFVRTGAFTPAEGTGLLDDLRERAATDRYSLARTYYSIIASVD